MILYRCDGPLRLRGFRLYLTFFFVLSDMDIYVLLCFLCL